MLLTLVVLSTTLISSGPAAAGIGRSGYGRTDLIDVPLTKPLDDFRPKPIYKIRLHAIATANNDGSDASTYTASELQSRIAGINDIFYNAGIEFEFDPATDWEQMNATILNKYFTLLDDPKKYKDPNKNKMPPTSTVGQAAFRRAIADLHRGKLVIFFSKPDKLKYDKDLKYWTVVDAGGGGSSSSNARWVSMKGGSKSLDLAHEIGHYLHQVHPAVSGVLNQADAAAKIKKAVDEGLPKSRGLEALDGDRDYVLDTPADAKGSIWKDVYGDKCTTAGNAIDVQVDFDDSSQTYSLAPDRGLVMSYFKGCRFDNHFSPQQIARMRDAVENMNRHDLVSQPSAPNAYLARRGSAQAGAIDDVQVVRVGGRRLVTVSVNKGQMQLIPWSVSTDGYNILRLKGSAQAGPVSQIAALHVGLGNVLTAVRDSSGNLKLITWRVNADGTIRRLRSYTAGAVSRIAATRWDRLSVVTAVRDGAGNLKVIAWRVNADGTIVRLAEASAGYVSQVEVTPRPQGVTTSVRGSNGNLKVIAWNIWRDKKHVWHVDRKGSRAAGYVSRISATALDFDYQMASTVRTKSGDQKVIVWDINHLGLVRRGGGLTIPGGCDRLESVRLGVNTLVTACRNPWSRGLKMSAVEVSADGNTLSLRGHAYAGGIGALSLARAGEDIAVSAVRTNSGTLMLIAWQLQ